MKLLNYAFFYQYFNKKMNKTKLKFHPIGEYPYFPGKSLENLVGPCIVKVDHTVDKGTYGFIEGEIVQVEDLTLHDLYQYAKDQSYEVANIYRYRVPEYKDIIIGKLMRINTDDWYSTHIFVCKINGEIYEMFRIHDISTFMYNECILIDSDNDYNGLSYNIVELDQLLKSELTEEDIKSILIPLLSSITETIVYKRFIKDGKVVAICPIEQYRVNNNYVYKAIDHDNNYPYKAELFCGENTIEAFVDEIQQDQLTMSNKERIKWHQDNMVYDGGLIIDDSPLQEVYVYAFGEPYAFKVFSSNRFIASLLDYPELVEQIEKTRKLQKETISRVAKYVNVKNKNDLNELRSLSLASILRLS